MVMGSKRVLAREDLGPGETLRRSGSVGLFVSHVGKARNFPLNH